MTTQRRFTPLDILNRCCEYGVTVSLDAELSASLSVDIPKSLEPDKRSRMLSVISEHKPEILAYLRSLESVPLCSECLNDDVETPCHIVGPDELMYCQRHYDELINLADEAQKAQQVLQNGMKCQAVWCL